VLAFFWERDIVSDMAVTINLQCNSCGKRHNFCFPDETTFQPGARYGYVCSDVKLAGSFMAPDDLDEQSEVLPKCPRGSIEVRRIHVGS
jgi:hypothetical protein